MARCHDREPKRVRTTVGLESRFLWLGAAVLGAMSMMVLSLRVSAEGPEPASPPARVETAGQATRESGAGSLVICGGGRLPDAVHDRFLELAGGPQARIVIIPTASSDFALRFSIANMERWRPRVAAFDVLHTRSRTEADDPQFARPLAEATGVWFTGGDQSRIAGTYVDTAVERHLGALLKRGGVIGGTSAGAAIMTRVMITGGRSRATLGRGFDFLPASVVDQHFLKRNRLGRMLSLLAEHPDLAGFGIDEGTALVLSGDRLSVIGDSYVVAYMPTPTEPSSQLEILRPGDQLDVSRLLASGHRARAGIGPGLAARSGAVESAAAR
jgi:cyanophycinase